MPTLTSTVTVDNKSVELPVKEGAIGPSVIDISKLYGQTGMFTYDPGFTSTAATESKITYIDGDAGILLYRGYPIDQLAEHGDFLETCYLLLYGELPTAAQKADFDYRVTRHTMVHDQMHRFFTGFRRDAHPMAIMVASSACSRPSITIDRHLRPASAHDRFHAYDREDADARRDGLQVLHRPALRVSAQRSTTPRTSCACALRCRPKNTRSTLCSRGGSTGSSSCTPTMSRTPRPRRCGSPALPARTPSPASPPVSPVSGGLPMAAPTRRR